MKIVSRVLQMVFIKIHKIETTKNFIFLNNMTLMMKMLMIFMLLLTKSMMKMMIKEMMHALILEAKK